MTKGRAAALVAAVLVVVVVVVRGTLRGPTPVAGRSSGGTTGSPASTGPGPASGSPSRSDDRGTRDEDELAGKTRAELYELAKAADIRGRSSMSKQALLDALTGR